MRLTFSALIAGLVASPAFAAGDVFFSLRNTDFIVLLAFLLFVGVLIYFKVPKMMGSMLDSRAEGIKSELDEARALREEAQTLLASYERKQQEVKEQADRIVTSAKAEANEAADQARADLEKSIARRMAAAEEQIDSAQAAAVHQLPGLDARRPGPDVPRIADAAERAHGVPALGVVLIAAPVA